MNSFVFLPERERELFAASGSEQGVSWGRFRHRDPMKRHWITYTDQWVAGSMSYWVHREADGRPWHEAKIFDPPLPRPVPCKGYPCYHVEVNGVIFHFSSPQEIATCLEVLSLKLLPTTIRLAKQRGTGIGPNQHWLSRLPPKAKPWRYRQKAVKYLRKAQAQFAEDCRA